MATAGLDTLRGFTYRSGHGWCQHDFKIRSLPKTEVCPQGSVPSPYYIYKMEDREQ